MEEVEIRVTGHIDPSWQDWLGGLKIAYSGNDTVFTGAVRDQSALYGLLSQLSDLGMRLISVNSHVSGHNFETRRE